MGFRVWAILGFRFKGFIGPYTASRVISGKNTRGPVGLSTSGLALWLQGPPTVKLRGLGFRALFLSTFFFQQSQSLEGSLVLKA